MSKIQFHTAGGALVRLNREEIDPTDALEAVFSSLNSHKGAVFSSGFDYPGRHSRWDIGFFNPALEFISKGREFTISSLNDQGRALLPLVCDALKDACYLENHSSESTQFTGLIKSSTEFFTEEERSRQPSVFSVLRSLIEFFKTDHPAGGDLGFFGAFGYDLVFQFEQIEQKLERSDEIVDCHLFLPLEVVVVDRKKELASRLVYCIETPDGPTSSMTAGGVEIQPAAGSGPHEIECDHAPGEFTEKVKRVIDGAHRGDYFEVVLSQTFSSRFDDTPTALFQRLSKLNPSPYMFLINFGEQQLIGASPEIYVRVTGQRYETCPIAGTIERGATALEDADKVREILSSEKDESELTMCTDVDRNDMARVCTPGSVRVIGRRQLEFYSHLIHTVDHLEGELAGNFDSIDAFQTHMWACTVTGAPKPAALQEIENLENSPRGWYSGAIGMLSFTGNINTGITLRTAHIKNGRATVRAGATLLYGSSPELEEQETRTKAAAFLAALTASKQEPNKPMSPDMVTRISKLPRKELVHGKKVLLVDCRDSFVHNLAAYLRALGAEVTTVRAGFPLELLGSISPELVLLSPGPGTPEEFGVPALVGELASRKLPTFGVCLGHQGIGQHFGAKISTLSEPEHGKLAIVEHNGDELFADIHSEFEAGRYHSLYLERSSIPDCLEVLANCQAKDAKPSVVMAIRHKELPIAGVQFHPESLMTLKQETGFQLLINAISTLL